MKQIRNVSDIRNRGWCVHCGGPSESQDHNPSKVFIDPPLPANLPVVPSCQSCNSGFSSDEEYLACLLECVVTGSADPASFERTSIAKSLSNNAKLARDLAAAKTEADGQIIWMPDHGRVAKIVTKLARGHVAFEQNEPQLHEPDELWFRPLALMEELEQRRFEGELGEVDLWPEVGSRAMHRLVEGPDDAFTNGWLVVQPDRYRYRTTMMDGVRVRLVIREYLAAEVAWT